MSVSSSAPAPAPGRGSPSLSRRGPLPGALAVALLGLAAAIVVTVSITTRNARVAGERFEVASARMATQIEQRVWKFHQGLRSARGAMVAVGVETITRERFLLYSQSRDVDTEFPGARGFGFIRRLRPEAEADFVRRARLDGAPDFAVRQLSPHDGERFVVQYIEPFDRNQAAMGLDIASHTHPREAALAAMATGMPTLTAPITLVQAAGFGPRGFLLLLPVFRSGSPSDTPDQRRAATIGWTYAPLVIDEVLAGLDTADGGLDAAITDATAGQNRFYGPAEGSGHAAGFDLTHRIGLFGRVWLIHVRARPKFLTDLDLPQPVPAGAMTFAVSLPLAALAYLVLSSRQRQFLASLERSRMAAIVEGSNDAIIGKGLDGTITDWNPAAERIFGYSAAEAVGHKVSALILPPHLQSEEDDTLARIRQGILVPHFPTLRMRSDGRLLSMLVSVSPIRALDGTIAGAATTARDISKQLAAEESIRALNATLEQQIAERTAQLHASSALQAAILNYAGYAVIATDRNGLVTLFNPAAERMLGYRAEDLIGKATPALFHDGREIAERAAALSVELGIPIAPGFGVVVARTERGQPNSGEWTYVTKAGLRLPVLLNVSALRATDGAELGFLGIAMDLTEQHRRAAEFEAAKKAAESAANSKAEFLATMSHELRTPLNSIIGFSELMLDDGTASVPELRRHARIVHDASRALVTVVNDVLDMSKIEAGQLDLDPHPFSLPDLVQGTVALLRNEAAAKGLAMAVDLPIRGPTALVGDEGRIRQILINLLSNAVKFTASGTIGVSVALGEVRAGAVPLRISVADTGIGIPDSKRHRLFERFSQADSSTSRRFGGTGLGLAICRSLVTAMGGAIGFDSTDGQGSTFWITLDLPVAEEVAPKPPAIATERGLSTVPSLSILVAEDVAMNQELAVMLLHRLGHRADVVADGAAALDAVRRTEYDLVLMDVQMPGMDGIEATRRIRDLGGRYARMPIIALTANVLAEDVARFREFGMSDHLGKPFVWRQLAAVIERWAPSPSAPQSPAEGQTLRGGLYDAALTDLCDLVGQERMGDLMRAFVPEARRRLAAICAPHAAADDLAREAHALAAAAGQLGFVELARLCERIEGDARRRGEAGPDIASLLRDAVARATAAIGSAGEQAGRAPGNGA